MQETSAPYRRDLAQTLTRIFRRHGGSPAAVFCHLALVALELERLRGDLVRRRLFEPSHATEANEPSRRPHQMVRAGDRAQRVGAGDGVSARTGTVELEVTGRATDRLLFPGLGEELKSHHELARRYQHYWPPPAPAAERRTEELSKMLKAARARLAAWAEQADPIITTIEKLSQNAADLEQLRAALQSAGDKFPDIHSLSRAGPKLQVRLFALPAGVLLRELPALLLVMPWQTPDASYALAVGQASDISDVEAQLQGLKGHALPLLSWLPASPDEAVTAMSSQFAELAHQRAASTAKLKALSEQFKIAAALADIALIEWLNEHANELRGSDHLAWVTGWTSDVSGAVLRRALDASGARYILRLLDAPAGMNAPLVLHNPGWARDFEVFARMLGRPGDMRATQPTPGGHRVVNLRLHVRRYRSGRCHLPRWHRAADGACR